MASLVQQAVNIKSTTRMHLILCPMCRVRFRVLTRVAMKASHPIKKNSTMIIKIRTTKMWTSMTTWIMIMMMTTTISMLVTILTRTCR